MDTAPFFFKRIFAWHDNIKDDSEENRRIVDTDPVFS